MSTPHTTVTTNHGYTYTLLHEAGTHFSPDFKPELTPAEMLELGVFDGMYFNESPDEFPQDWFVHAKLANGTPDPSLNYFGVHASQPLSVWQSKGWIHPEDPLGWFQWYCRYYQGRRIPAEDSRQIKRWRAMRRHIAQLIKYCTPRDMHCRPRQRQALLHWAYDTRKI